MTYLNELLDRVPLSQRERARATYAVIRSRVPHGVWSSLPALLEASPDPDGALNLFERLTEGAAPEIFRVFDRERNLIHYAITVFGHSEWLGEALIQNTDVLHWLAREKSLDRSRSCEEFRENFGRFRSRSFETDTATLLAQFKKREYIRIFLRDVLGIASLAETTGEISALADVLIAEAQEQAEVILRTRFGYPEYDDPSGHRAQNSMSVLSLGKLGGSELNYSSDIDLMYLYRTVDDAGTASITPREFYVRLAQQITAILTSATREGQPYRVDLRLRPQGSQGEAAIPLSHAIYYYANSAHGWERQAMIKARHSAGDQALSREFLRAVRAHVYTEALNMSALATMDQMRRKIRDERRRGARAWEAESIDVKMDNGGIRDIEFLAQCLQRIYGGTETWLQSGGTLFALQKLHDKAHISGKDFHELTIAYEFLRHIEHRLQLRHGRQTYRLPRNDRDLRILARSLRGNSATDPVDFLRLVQRRMAIVNEIYERTVFQQQQSPDTVSVPAATGRPQDVQDPAVAQMMQRLANDSAALFRMASRSDLTSAMRRNLHHFIASAGTSTERYQSVLKAPAGVERALKLFDASEYLTDILMRYPGEVATLERLEECGDADSHREDPFPRVASGNMERTEAMALLREYFRHLCFVCGARDLLYHRDVFHSIQELSHAADQSIAAALGAVNAPAGLAVFALGRLGSNELDIHSDADLIFVREEAADGGACLRAAERMIEFLVSYTQQGTVFPVDTRLRPHGTQGELIVTARQLKDYFLSAAQPGEALTYLKLRHIAGSGRAATEALAARKILLGRFTGDPGFRDAVVEMRLRLEKGDTGPNLKTGRGGTYDIDFICGYLEIVRGCDSGGSLHQRLSRLRDANALTGSQFGELASAARFYRTLEHLLRLITGRPRKSLPVSEASRATVERLVPAFLKSEFPGGVEAKRARVQENVRGLFDGVMGR